MSARARFELDQLLALVVACAFLGTGIAKVAGVEFVMATFEGWTASPLLLRSIGLVELTCAVLVLVPRLRLVGTASLALIMVGALLYHLALGEWMLLGVPVTALTALFGLLHLELDQEPWRLAELEPVRSRR